MPIQKGDVKLVKSEVMDDVEEGGGAPTANVIADGVSNAIFPDVSESDRAAGRVSARKVHVWVQSPDTATYLGPNVIVAEPPNDPNVSITLFTTNEVFDRRSAAISRIESYLNRGANYAGFLYGDHIEGQAVISVIQRTADLPPIGGTLALTHRQGYSNEFIQYVRIIEASATLRTFTDETGDFQRYTLALKLSDPLRQDFPGFDARRIDPTKEQLALSTKISDVVVADAAKYYGVVKTTEAAVIGDFSIKAEGIFSQLVPSAQIETPVADARTNQLLVGVVSGGGSVTRSVSAAFAPTKNLFLGGSVKPGTLTIARSGVSVTDSGSKLLYGGSQVGIIDYENGVAQLTTDVFGTAEGVFTITSQSADAIQAVSQSQGVEVKAESRSLSYVVTIEPPPLPGTLSIAYMVAKQWYVLRDEGGGQIRGADTGYGAGNLNPTTGTVAVTLGALPDVGSEIIYQWVEPATAKSSNELTLENDGKLFWPINSDGLVSEEDGSKPITPGALSLAWMRAGVMRTATDNGLGGLVGDATGTVNYAKGKMRVSFNELPAKGTSVQLTLTTNATAPITDTPVAGVGNFGLTGIKPRSISFGLTPTLELNRAGAGWVAGSVPLARSCFDDGAGKLLMRTSLGGWGYYDDSEYVQIGTVDYTTGDYVIFGEVILPPGSRSLYNFIGFDNFFEIQQKFSFGIYNTLA